MTFDIFNNFCLLSIKIILLKGRYKNAEEPKFAVICKLTPDLDLCTIIMILYHRHGNIRIILRALF